VVTFESSLWEVRGPGKLVWTATTKTQNPTSAKDFATSLAKDVVPVLLKTGLVAPVKGNAGHEVSMSRQ
jgi:hypothetical protein